MSNFFDVYKEIKKLLSRQKLADLKKIESKQEKHTVPFCVKNNSLSESHTNYGTCCFIETKT